MEDQEKLLEKFGDEIKVEDVFKALKELWDEGFRWAINFTSIDNPELIFTKYVHGYGEYMIRYNIKLDLLCTNLLGVLFVCGLKTQEDFTNNLNKAKEDGEYKELPQTDYAGAPTLVSVMKRQVPTIIVDRKKKQIDEVII